MIKIERDIYIIINTTYYLSLLFMIKNSSHLIT